MLIISNIIWSKNKPKEYDKYVESENKILLLFERIGEMLVTCVSLIFNDFNVSKISSWTIILLIAFIIMILYEIYWIRYFKSNKTMNDMYSSLFGIPVAGATLPVEVREALKLAQCDDILEKLPNGINTIYGSKGVYLSGGEMQRINIARVILKNSPIVILDEATASLDAENETEVQETISKLVKDKTVLIIAHRMRTVTNANKIVVLKDGLVAEQGEPEELLNKNGIFKDMVEKQIVSC